MTFAIACISTVVIAQPPIGDARPGDVYGTITSINGAISIAEIPAMLKGDEVLTTKVKARVLDVCTKKGCWLVLEVNDSTTAFVKMKDYGFFVPLAAIGKTVVIDGEVKMKTTSVGELKHYAEDAKKSKEEIAAITKPEKEIRVMAKGIVIVE